MSRAAALRTADTLCFNVAVQIERGFIIVFVLLHRVGRAIHVGTLILVIVHRARVVVLPVVIFGVVEVLRHNE